MERKKYVNLELSVLYFEKDDVVCNSTGEDIQKDPFVISEGSGASFS